MKVLVLGGRDFVGRHIVEQLLAADDDFEITLLNRGQTNPDLFAQQEILLGDRNKDHHLIEGREWDVIVDTSGYFPGPVDALAKKLKSHKNRYIFISSCSVYDHLSKSSAIDEDSPIVDLEVDLSDTSSSTYGARKYLCEKSIERHFKENFTAIRPGLIVGAHDSTFRFPYWVERIREGGEVLAPGDPSAPVQFIDAHDLAIWIVHVIRKGITGTFNAVGPDPATTFGSFLEGVQSSLQSDAEFTWVPEEFLLEKGVAPWVELPLWLSKDWYGFLRRKFSKARQKGLELRSLADTVVATDEWLQEADLGDLKENAMTREKERDLLEEWKRSSLDKS